MGEQSSTDSPVTAQPSRQARQLAEFLSRYVRPAGERSGPSGITLAALRRVSDSSGLRRLPPGSRAWPARYTAYEQVVRGVWLRAAGAHPANGVLLYLHGGGFVFGSPRSHRGVAHQLSKRLGMPAFALDYRRAPEHPFPAAADEALAAYRLLLDRGVDPGRLLVAGDSAGGHLTACLLGDLARLGLPMPAATATFSPLFDLTCAEALRRDAAARDPFVPPTFAAKCGLAYAGGVGLHHPRVDVLAADKTGWPPMLIQAGGTECLLGDAEAMAASLRAAGVACELQVWPGQVHAFPVFVGSIPEARTALRYTATFLSAHTRPRQ